MEEVGDVGFEYRTASTKEERQLYIKPTRLV
jgi:hypothetical protein